MSGCRNETTLVSRIDSGRGAEVVTLSVMNLFGRWILLSVAASLSLIAIASIMSAQVTSGETNSPVADASLRTDAAALQKKANEAQSRIHGNKEDSEQLKRAVKLNEVASAKEVLLRNGFTVQDLENAKVTLRTGGGKAREDELEISARCCDPKEITIQRSGENFTK